MVKSCYREELWPVTQTHSGQAVEAGSGVLSPGPVLSLPRRPAKELGTVKGDDIRNARPHILYDVLRNSFKFKTEKKKTLHLPIMAGVRRGRELGSCIHTNTQFFAKHAINVQPLLN